MPLTGSTPVLSRTTQVTYRTQATASTMNEAAREKKMHASTMWKR
jgi:hypothetical protein